MNKPAPTAISVVMPLYNGDATVRDTLTTALDQSPPPAEIIVVDDGSTDQGVETVSRLANDRIRVIRQANRGVSAARNAGIAEARSELVAFLDADDQWLPGHLAALTQLRRKFPGCVLYATSYLLGEQDSAVTMPARLHDVPEGWSGLLPDYFTLASRSDPPLWTSALAADRQALQAIGGFPDGVAAGEDLLTWARLATRGDVAYLATPTAIFRQAPGHVYDAPPTRPPDPDDVVGAALRRLQTETPAAVQPGLRRYISQWYKMRASIYLRLGRRRDAFRETCTALRFNPLERRLYAYLSLLLCPSAWQTAVFRRFGARPGSTSPTQQDPKATT